MYKKDKCIMFKNSSSWSVGYWKDFETKSEFELWMDQRLNDGLKYVGEKNKEVEVYPQVLKLDLKSSGNSYYTVIERFTTSEEYQKYCEYKLMEGFKVIGSRPYFK